MNYLRLLSLQARKSNKSLGSKIAVLILFLLPCVSFTIEAINLYGKEYSTVLSAARMWSLNGMGDSSFHYLYGVYLMFGIPLISTLIFSDEILSVKNNHITQFLFIRTNRLKYYSATAVICFIKCALLTFASLALNQILWLICCPFTSNQPLTQFVSTDFEGAYLLIFPKLFFDNPYLYNLLYMGLISLLAGVFAFLGLSLCFVLKKAFQILVIPTILYLAEGFISAGIGYYRFSVAETLSPLPSVRNLSFITYVVFIVTLFITAVIIYSYGVFVKRDEFA